MKRCPIFQEHQFNYDAKASSIDKSVFRCLCGEEEIVYEDSGTGA